ncbi:MAG TPA: 30S ribosomal protein S12 methylthiotransferase RimO [Clostridia bacterium]|nr:30S ribosomal protein S12 methylthiotransferase RimO [Clostridia bacterium]
MNRADIKKTENENKKFFIETLGCSKNQVDSEFLAGRLISAGLDLTYDFDEADYIIVNTCGFIADAMEESVNAILEFGRLKSSNQTIVAAGCLSERFADEIRSEMPEIDIIIGVTKFLELPEMFEKFECDGNRILNIGDIDRYVDYREEERVLLDQKHYAYVKISEGCDNRCTYCTIPGFKGGYKSRRIEDLISEVNKLAIMGVKEIVLIAQDTTKYGIDIYGEFKLVELLEELVLVDGIEWIRILYAYPDVLDESLINTIRKHEKICNYLDMPIQHCHDDMLKRMNRHTSERDLENVLKMIRKLVPDMSIRTTLMVGFPGESQEAFEKLFRFVEKQEFDKLGVFEYSPEEGTPAAGFDCQIDSSTKADRKERIMILQKQISENANNKRIGMNVKAIIDEKVENEDVYIGRTQYDAPEVDGVLYIYAKSKLAPGDFVNVKITDALEYDLIGVIENESAE